MCVVTRTQVYLGNDELELLDRVGEESGATRSELIRRAIRETYGRRSVSDKLKALDASAGIWRDRDFTGAQYAVQLRGDLNARLKKLGLE